MRWLWRLTETLGALVIAVGARVVAVAGLLRHAARVRGTNSMLIRLSLARYLRLALPTAIFSTSVAPSWERFGELAATV